MHKRVMTALGAAAVVLLGPTASAAPVDAVSAAQHELDRVGNGILDHGQDDHDEGDAGQDDHDHDGDGRPDHDPEDHDEDSDQKPKEGDN